LAKDRQQRRIDGYRARLPGLGGHPVGRAHRQQAAVKVAVRPP
jgi:hypothetical protein